MDILRSMEKKNAPWTYLEDFNNKTNCMFDDIFHVLPFSLAEYGKYKNKYNGDQQC